jgi:hypothetical protein
MRQSIIKSVAVKRGYDDLDPTYVWDEWQRVRAELAGNDH